MSILRTKLKTMLAPSMNGAKPMKGMMAPKGRALDKAMKKNMGDPKRKPMPLGPTFA